MAHRQVADRPFQNLPAVAAILDDPHPLVVVKKSAQVGLTEAMVSLALWAADHGHGGRGNVLYVMPTVGQMEDFAQQRVDRAIQDSAHLRSRLQPEPPRRKAADSKRLKHLGAGWIFMRGSENRSQLISVDADVVILDEYDRMGEGVLELAQARLASSRRPLLRVISTPRFPEAGIDALYRLSDQRLYLLPCGACGTEQELRWPDNVDAVRLAVVCRYCHARLDVRVPGRWVAQAPGDGRPHGYQLNRLYSPWLNVAALVEASTGISAAAQQEFHNSDLGEVFSPPGSGLTMDLLDCARGDYALSQYAGEPCVMGVDVGTRFHVVIRGYDPQTTARTPRRRSIADIPPGYIDRDTGRPGPGMAAAYGLPPLDRAKGGQKRRVRSPLWFAGDVGSIAEVEALMDRYHVTQCVIDRQPEVHLVAELGSRRRRQVALSQYGRQDPGHDRSVEGGVHVLHVNRNEAIEQMVARFPDHNPLPQDARGLGARVKDGQGEYYREMLALRRIMEQDSLGNWVARWVGSADHYAHAEVYAALAMWLKGDR